jgi:NAD(P)-dependent dehydrogenase (short-subunit alcohol dehydrogenase family)
MDVADPASITAGAALPRDTAIDMLYNVAGFAGVAAPELESADWAVFDEVFDINVKGPLRVLHAFLPRLGRGSKVINFSSQLAASTWPHSNYYAYCAAKAALGRLMRSVAMDLKERGVIVGIVHPGWVQTDMGGASADLTPQESASGVYKVAKDWTLDRSGEFLKWNGEPHPW